MDHFELTKLILNSLKGSIIPISNTTLNEIKKLKPEIYSLIEKVGFSREFTLDKKNPPSPVDKSKAAELVRNSVKESLTRNLNFLSKEDFAIYQSVLEKAVEVGDTFQIVIDHQQAGILLIREFSFNANPCSLVSWIWRDPNLSLKSRSEFLQTFEKLVQQTAKHSIVVASVHVKNEKSLRFFSDAGFQPLCLFLF